MRGRLSFFDITFASIVVLSSLGAILLGGCGGDSTSLSTSQGTGAQAVAGTEAEPFETGLEHDPPEVAISRPLALDPGALASPTDGAQRSETASPSPSFAVALDSMPPVGNQGHCGSCVAWSWAYTFGTTVANRATPGNSALPAYQVNPLLMYATVIGQTSGKTCGSGTNPKKYIDFFETGTFSNAQTPTYPGGTEPAHGSDPATICGAVSQAQATPPTLDTTFQIPAGTVSYLDFSAKATPGSADDVVEQVKNDLSATRLPIPIAIVVPASLQKYKAGQVLEDEYFERAGDCTHGGHGMVVVGYDDTLPCPSPSITPSCSGTPVAKPDWKAAPAPGAMLVRNSWGSSWGSSFPGTTQAGYCWVAYDTFRHIVDTAAVFASPPDAGTPGAARMRPAAPKGIARSRRGRWAAGNTPGRGRKDRECG